MGAFFKGALSNVLRGAGGAFVLVSAPGVPPGRCGAGWGGWAAVELCCSKSCCRNPDYYALAWPPLKVLYDEIKKILNPDALPSSE